jgi:predicted membrane channel-forming protein YqfA (hemolysin III family)
MIALIPPALFVLAWIFALVGMEAPSTDGSTPFDENALRWILFLALGWTAVGAAIPHTVFARETAKAIGWETNGFQYEVGFANLAIGLAGIYASNQDASSAWVAAALAGGVFLALAAANHVVEIVRDRNYAPGNTMILLSDFGVPISLLALLIATGAI